MTKVFLVGALVILAYLLLTVAIMAIAPWIAGLMIVGFVIWILAMEKAPKE